MNIITISREFGSGGRELAKLLSDKLSYAYYDKEIICKIAEETGKDKAYIVKALNKHELDLYNISRGQSFAMSNIYDLTNAELLAKQRDVVLAIAEKNENCVIVGRNADVILAEYNPLNIFICAPEEERIARCIKSSHKNEGEDEKDIKRKIRSIDKARSRTREMLSTKKWGDPHCYSLVVNTKGQDLMALSENLATFAKTYFKQEN